MSYRSEQQVDLIEEMVYGYQFDDYSPEMLAKIRTQLRALIRRLDDLDNATARIKALTEAGNAHIDAVDDYQAACKNPDPDMHGLDSLVDGAILQQSVDALRTVLGGKDALLG